CNQVRLTSKILQIPRRDIRSFKEFLMSDFSRSDFVWLLFKTN
ncbi:MAG: hypothetical protein ACJAVF_003213, partial [Paraglaciecola sp.]